MKGYITYSRTNTMVEGHPYTARLISGGICVAKGCFKTFNEAYAFIRC